MVKVRKDLTGQMFGRLKVLCQAEDYIFPSTQAHTARWKCECQCEKKKILYVIGANLKSGNQTSCGCTRKLINTYDLTGEYGIMYPTNRPKFKILFDLEDYDKIKGYTWLFGEGKNGGVYAQIPHSEKGQTVLYMANLIMGQPNVNHKDRNLKDNRKQNLRIATRSQINMAQKKRKANTSGITGVTWLKEKGKWLATISINKKSIHLESSKNKTDIIRLRLQAEHDIYGEFAPQQHLYKEYGIPDTRLHQYLIQKLTDRGYDVNSILAQN